MRIKIFQNSLIMFLAATLVLSSCKKETDTPVTDSNQNTPPTVYANPNQQRNAAITCGTTTTANLIAGQSMTAGTVSVANTTTNLLVTYTTTNGWYLTELHLYVGDCNLIPRNGKNPVPGHFPYATSFSGNSTTTYTFSIPLSNLPNCFCVAAHAVVSGHGTETAWGEGVRIVPQGNWAMKFAACKQTCVVNEGCTLDPAQYPGDNDLPWPVSTITMGGYTYVENDLNDILISTQDISDLIYTLTNIKLSAATITTSATIWSDVAAIDAWLATQNKISFTNLPPVPASVMVHVTNIQEWTRKHTCP